MPPPAHTPATRRSGDTSSPTPARKSAFTAVTFVALIVLLALAFGSHYFSRKREAQPTTPATAKTPTLDQPVGPPASAAPSTVTATAGRIDDLQILKNASREELLAYAHDLLAKGGSLKDIIALLEYLAAAKPEFAIDLARDIGRTDGERHVLLYTVISDWARLDPANALSWAQQKSSVYNVPGNASLLYVVLEQVASDNPDAAIAATENALRRDAGSANAVSGGEFARLAVEALVRTGGVELGRQALERWARGPDSARLSETAYEVVALAVAQKSFGDGALWLQSLPSSAARNQTLAPFAAAWAQQDAQAAMDWAQELDPNYGGDDVRVATFERWLKSDPDAAAHWLRSHNPPADDRLRFFLNDPAITKNQTVNP